MAHGIEFTPVLGELHEEWQEDMHYSYLAFTAKLGPNPRPDSDQEEIALSQEYTRLDRIEENGVKSAEILRQKIQSEIIRDKEYTDFEKASLVTGFLGNYRNRQHKQVKERAKTALLDLLALDELLSATGTPFCIVTINEQGYGISDGSGISVDPQEFIRSETKLTKGSCSVNLGTAAINWLPKATGRQAYGVELPRLPRRILTFTDPDFDLEPRLDLGLFLKPVYIFGGRETINKAVRVIPKLLIKANDFPY